MREGLDEESLALFDLLRKIRNFLWDDRIGLPDPAYSDSDVETKTEAGFRHIHYVYRLLPSPVCGERAA